MTAGTQPTNEDAAAHAASRRPRSWVRTAAIVAGVVVIGGLVAFVVEWNRSTTHPVSMDAARRRAGTGTTSPERSTTPTRLQPAAGVYEYRGDGAEHLDTPPKTATQGPTMPGTVTDLGGGCWRLRVDYNTNHWQSWDYCSVATGLTEKAGAFFQRLDLVAFTVDTSSSYVCDPPVDTIRTSQTPGDQWPQRCHGTSTASKGDVISSGPYTYVGQENLDIGGQRVTALHYHRVRALSGGPSGTEDVNTLFDAHTGMPLQNSRVITVHSDALIGGVTYTETGTFHLASLTPTR